ncbi:MAG: glycosyltransferase family 2 protein [Deltaproteobacteria bacterium]|nr:glycosyltransferase family 2 protein [Deltaproteobacteria bacterium]
MTDLEIPVTVLMPVYNVQPYLEKAVESILRQTFGDFEFLIIDDGSTDKSPEILQSYPDPRIRVIHQENQGVAAALRLGVSLSRGQYIARMDADDESLPDRLEIQKKILDQNPEAVLGYGLHDLMDEKGDIIRNRQGEGFSTSITKWLLIWMNVFTHPTIMIRTRALRENQINYRLETNGAEDFDLWNRLSFYGDFLFVPEVLLKYRIHADSVNRLNLGERQFRSYSLVVRENFRRYGLTISDEMAEELVVISGQTSKNPLTFPYRYLPNKLSVFSEEIARKFSSTKSIDTKKLFEVRAGQLLRWARCLLQSSRKGSFILLMKAVQLRKSFVVNRLFLLTFLSLFLPERTLVRINEKRTRPLI